MIVEFSDEQKAQIKAYVYGKQELAQKIRDRAQKALNISPHYPSVLCGALEDIIELCQEQLEEEQ